MPFINRQSRNGRHTGFSLVELLVVIAIIALLAAIIFPVFATVRENARQSNSLSNLHDISTKLAQYQLDNHRYPDVLFGYAYSNGGTSYPMDKALGQAQADCAITPAPATNAQDCVGRYFPGLYPEYINNVNEFTDPNNQADFATVVTPDFNVLCPSADDGCASAAAGDLVAATHLSGGVPIPGSFYAADAYDSSPKVTAANTLDKTKFVTRYQSLWTMVTSNAAPPAGMPTPPAATSETQVGLYTRQLHWQFPPPDAYVTCTTYHIPQSNKVLALFADGSVRKFDYSQFIARGADVDSIAVTSMNPTVSPAPFWQVLPSGQ